MTDVPGLDPLFFLLKIDQLVGSGRYDRIVLDLAPTGETLSLLQLPELLGWWMERMFPIGRLGVRTLRPFVKGLYGIELPDRRAMNDVEAFYLRLRSIQSVLKDPAVASVRLVTQPEHMVVEETRRSYMYLNLFGYSVDHVYVNGVYPADQVDSFFHSWVAHQATHLAEIEAAFPHLPITRVPRFPSDLSGLDDIGRLADQALDAHTFDVREGLAREIWASAEAGYELRLPIPLARREDVQLSQTPADLVIRIGNFQRNIPLPATLHGYEVDAARLEAGTLTVSFGRAVAEVAP